MDGKYSHWLSRKFTLSSDKFSTASKWSLTVKSCWGSLCCTFHQINDISKLNCYARLFLSLLSSILWAHTAPPTKSNIFSGSSEAWNISDSYSDNAVWKEGKKWVGGLSDDVVSGASAPFSFLPWSSFSPVMAQWPSQRWYPRQPPIVCCLFLSFFYLFI